MPNSLKRGVLVPIPKARKDATIRENNRGITLLPILYKIYQCLLKQRLANKIIEKISPVQGGGLKGVSCLHTSLLVRETISCNVENNRNVYVCFLDAKKAFDSVWINGMIYKLFHLEIDPKFCRIVKDMYTQFSCAVRVNNELSSWFNIKMGVQQGAPLSLWLYELYINDLIVILRESGFGAKIANINVTCPTYADDMAIIATSPGKLQHLIDLAYVFSEKWQYQFNAQKSEVMYFGEKQKQVKFYLGNEVMKNVFNCMHLGTPMSSNPKYECKSLKENVYKCKQTLAAVHGIGSSRVPVDTCSLSKLYWSLCVPKMCYSCEVMTMRTESRNVLENAHWDMAKRIQGIPKSTPNPCVLPQIKWTNINGYMDMLKLVFLWRIIVSNMASIYKKVIIHRLLSLYDVNEIIENSPVSSCLYVMRKYDLYYLFVRGILNGPSLTVNQFKQLVKDRIKKYECSQSYANLMFYKNVEVFKNVISHSFIWPWYIHASRYPRTRKKCKVLMKLILGFDMCTKSFKQEKYCHCSSINGKSVNHILFECSLVNEERVVYFKRLETELPPRLYEDFCKLNFIDRTEFILSGFNVRYTCEMSKIYTCFLQFTCGIYKSYMNQINACHDM